MLHDCIYQFLRLFYHSRFKPQQLEMTLSQLSAPFLDLILVLPLIFRLYQDLSRFSNETKLRVQSKPEIKEHFSVWRNLVQIIFTKSGDRIWGSLTKVSVIFTVLLIISCISYWRESKTLNYLSSKDISKSDSFWDKSQGSTDFL